MTGTSTHDAELTSEPAETPHLRPRWHYTPASNWMNDPNGLVHLNGVYHLFHQYNPHGNDWGHMSWGHATSTDMLSWTEQPPALVATAEEQVYSGSVVIDYANTAGLASLDATDSTTRSADPKMARDAAQETGPNCGGAIPTLVAAYTSVSASGNQAQALASSSDGGSTWLRRPGGPVLDRGSTDFRDPKVLRAADRDGQQRWVMLTVEAVQRQVLIHSSTDLVHWELESTFGPLGPTGVVWECPDLFPLLIDGDPERRRWVLVISTNPPDLSGPSRTHYLVGDFDGHRFTPDPGSVLRLFDHGRDFYAATSFEGLADAERTVLAWAGNWQYAAATPTHPWRGVMSLPRQLSLRSARDGTGTVTGTDDRGGGGAVGGAVDARVSAPQLVQALPQSVEQRLLQLPARVIGAQRVQQPLVLKVGRHLRLQLDWHIDAATTAVGVNLLLDGPHRTRLIYDVSAQTLVLDRSRSHGDHFHDAFASVVTVSVPLRGQHLHLDVILDGCLVEVFADGGAVTITELAMADATARDAILFSEGAPCTVSGIVHDLTEGPQAAAGVSFKRE